MRLRCKVLERDGQTYLVATGVINPKNPGRMLINAMREERTLTLELTLDQWNALPFHWFEDQGPAERKQETWP